MKTRCRLLAVAFGLLVACSDLGGPSTTGDIAMRIVFTNNASPSAVLDSVLVVVDAIDDGGGVPWTVMVRTDTTVVTDSLLAGQYEVAIIGYASNQVDAFDLDTVTVVAGASTTAANLQWSNFFPTMNPIASPTSDTVTAVSWSAVPGATEYVLEWGTDPLFAGPQTDTTAGTTATIVTSTLGDHFVRVRAVHPFVSDPVRYSDPVQFLAVTNLQLRFEQHPPASAQEAGSVFTVSVEARDSLGILDSAFIGTVTLALTAGTGTQGASLAGTLTRSAVNGVATFDDINVQISGSGYSLTASADQRLDGVSDAFDVVPGAPAALAFFAEPTGSFTAGVPIQPTVVVGSVDMFGNASNQFDGDVTLGITPNTGDANATLTGTTTASAQDGSVSFDDLSIDLVGSDYTLTATTAATGVADTLSGEFAVTAAAAASWTFNVQPSRTRFGQVMSPPVEATAVDAFNNLATSCNDIVTLSLLAGTGTTGATLSGTLAQTAVDGVVRFDDLSIDSAGIGYQLSISGCASSGQSGPFDITATPNLQIDQIPQPVSAGVVFQVVVNAKDSLGNQDSTFSGNVDIALVGGGVPLGGTTGVLASNGTATFSDLTIDTPGSQYQLEVTADGFDSGLSNLFDVVPGPPGSLSFVVQPTSSSAGQFMSPSIEVEVLDGVGNRVISFDQAIGLEITSGTGAPGAMVFNGTANANAGVARFDSAFVDLVGSSYTMTASGAGTTQVSSPFDITPGVASMLVFTQSPTTANAGVVIAPAVQVTAQDAFGNTASGFEENVTVTLSGGTPGAVLDGVTTIQATSGVSAFPGLDIDRAGVGYELTASNGTVTSATSTPFDVLPGAAVALSFVNHPTDTTAGATFSPLVTAEALDAFGNLATSFGDDPGDVVTASLTPGTGTPNANLRGTPTQRAGSGVVTFADINVDSVGAGYTIDLNATGLTSTTSAAFSIAHGPADRLVYDVQPSTVRAFATMSPPVELMVVDAVGNVATSFSGNVSLTLNPPVGNETATLAGGGPQAIVGGRVSFNALSIDLDGVGYSLTATTPGLQDGVSQQFTVLPPVFLVFTQQPTTTAQGQAITPVVTVTAQFQGGVATGFNGAVTLTLIPGTVGATLNGTVTVNANSGVAMFPGISVDTAGDDYTLDASAGGVQSGISDTFDIVVVTPAPIGFSEIDSDTSGVSNASDELDTSVLGINRQVRVSTAGVFARRERLGVRTVAKRREEHMVVSSAGDRNE